MHFYSNGRGNTATHFTLDDMRQQFASFPNIETAILEQRALLDTLAAPNQRSGPVGLLLDEWGVWDRMEPDEEKKYGRLFQQITMRSAVAAALGLNVIHRQAGKLVMTQHRADGERAARAPAHGRRQVRADYDLLRVRVH